MWRGRAGSRRALRRRAPREGSARDRSSLGLLAARTAQWDLFLEITAGARTRSSIVAWWIDHAHRREQGRLLGLAALRSLRLGLAARLGLPLPCFVDPTTDAQFIVDEEGSAIVVRREPAIASRRWSRKTRS